MNTEQNEAAFADFVKRLVDVANETKDQLDDTTGPIKKIFAEKDIVFGIWNDATKPYGVDFITLKGGRLADSVLENKNVTAQMDMRKFASDFVKVDDVRDGPRQGTIAEIRIGNYGRPEAVFTDGSILSLNAGNTRTLTKAYGADSAGWIGRTIEMRLGRVPYQGKDTDSVVAFPLDAPLDAAGLKAAQDRAAASNKTEMNDEIPF